MPKPITTIKCEQMICSNWKIYKGDNSKYLKKIYIY